MSKTITPEEYQAIKACRLLGIPYPPPTELERLGKHGTFRIPSDAKAKAIGITGMGKRPRTRVILTIDGQVWAEAYYKTVIKDYSCWDTWETWENGEKKEERYWLELLEEEKELVPAKPLTIHMKNGQPKILMEGKFYTLSKLMIENFSTPPDESWWCDWKDGNPENFALSNLIVKTGSRVPRVTTIMKQKKGE